MTTYLIPTDSEFIEDIARAIARSRLHTDASNTMEELTGVPLRDPDLLENTLDLVFDQLWAGQDEASARQRTAYRADALAAIRAINLKLIATP